MIRATRVMATIAISAAILFTGQSADAATLDAGEQSLLAEVNAFRSARGLSTLSVSDTLTQTAKWMSTDMAVGNYFSHTSLDGRSPFQRMADFGYPVSRTYTGENIAAGYTEAAKVLQGWINSPAHFAVLTNPNYRAIGIGRAYSAGSTYRWYWTANFGGIVDAATASFSYDMGFHAAFDARSADVTLAPGQTTQLVLALRNTGYRGWYANSPGQQANIGTADPLDSLRTDLATSGWLAASRPATQSTSWVGPGQIGWFAFDVKAPQTPGTYRLSVRGVVDGSAWLEGGATWTVTVR